VEMIHQGQLIIHRRIYRDRCWFVL